MPPALLAALPLVGAGWAGLVCLLPEGTLRAALVLLLGIVFVGVYVGLLVHHVRGALEGRRFLLHGLLVLAELAVLLAGFAAVHARLGVIDGTRPGSPLVHGFWPGAYLSVMTFTSVGFGDLAPGPAGRALAALQGLTGYVVLGVLASSAASILSPYDRAGPGDGPEGRG